MRRFAGVVILTLIVLVLALDGVHLAQPVWVLATSQCSFRETWTLFSEMTPLEHLNKEMVEQTHFIRTEDGLDLMSSPGGEIWMVHGDHILPYLLAEQQFDIYEPPGHSVHAGDVVLDCGANVGMFTRKALSRGASLVVAIEPAPHTLDALRRNLDAEIRAGRVIVYPKGVWDHDDELELSLLDTNEGANSVVLPRPTTVKTRVPLTTIDQIVAELKLPRVDFIKMDIEGAEKKAIAGGKGTIQKFHPRMSLSSEHLPDDYTAIPMLVKSIVPGYKVQGCDCIRYPWLAQAYVLAFDPIR